MSRSMATAYNPVGARTPRSHCDTAIGWHPTSAANAAWVNPSRRRSARMSAEFNLGGHRRQRAEMVRRAPVADVLVNGFWHVINGGQSEIRGSDAPRVHTQHETPNFAPTNNRRDFVTGVNATCLFRCHRDPLSCDGSYIDPGAAIIHVLAMRVNRRLVVQAAD